ncbi:MAG: hypothetical protein ACI8W7_003028 [Gammaproteobacteria bacterium]
MRQGPSAATLSRQLRPTGFITAPFKQNHVVPDTIDMAIALPIADFAKATFSMQCAARVIVGNDLRLQRPVAIRLGSANQRAQQGAANPLAMCDRVDIDADLSDSSRASRVRHGCERRPTEEPLFLLASNKPSNAQMRRIPTLPRRRGRHERRQSCGETLRIDRPNLSPVTALHRIDDVLHGDYFAALSLQSVNKS